MKKKHKKGIVVFTAPEDTVLNIFNYPDPFQVKNGDQVVFKIRFPMLSIIVSYLNAN